MDAESAAPLSREPIGAGPETVEIDPARRPRHVAIIMDGNGRWAAQRGLDRIQGHEQGTENIRRITRAAGELGVEYLTLWAFSTENWSRPEEEVQGILRILAHRTSCVCGDIVDELPLAQSTVSQHLKVLKDAGLVRGEIDGPRVCYCLEPHALRRLRALVAYL